MTQMTDIERIWQHDAYKTLEELAINHWVEEYAKENHGQTPTVIPDAVPQDGPRPQPVAHLNADTGAWETEENEAEIVVFFNKMYYCTQLYFMYWYRRTDARNKAHAHHPVVHESVRNVMANVFNYFLEYRCVYNRSHDHRGNRHARAGNDQDGDPRPAGRGRRPPADGGRGRRLVDGPPGHLNPGPPGRRLNPNAGEFEPALAAHQAAFYRMWTGVQPVVTAKGLLQFPGIDKADGEVQRMLRNNPVWRGNITHGALIPAVAARINALDARARGLHDERREQHRQTIAAKTPQLAKVKNNTKRVVHTNSNNYTKYHCKV